MQSCSYAVKTFNIHFNIILPATSESSNRLFLPGFRTKILYAFLFAPIYATCSAHVTVLVVNFV
jgi:hypothetical protein